MNVFVIPSWYPNRKNPIAGIFIKELFDFSAEIKTNTNFFISCWGHDQYYFNIKKPLEALSNFIHYLKAKPALNQIKSNLFEIHYPTLTWSYHIDKGNISGLINAARKNFQTIERQFGKIDIIHAEVSFPAGYVASIISREMNIPFVLSEQMSPFPFPLFVKENKLDYVISDPLHKAKVLTVLTESHKDQLLKWIDRKVELLPNPTDERKFIYAEPSSSIFNFFTLSTLAPQKGIDLLISAIAIMKERGYDSKKVHFRIGGDINKYPVYKSQAEKLNVSDMITWLGMLSRSEAAKEFSVCHVFVLPSRHESMGVVCSEAIASGKPVVSTKCGGPEYVIDATSGILVENENVLAVADGMISAFENYTSFNHTKIRESFDRRFSRKVIIDKLEHIYSTALR